MKIFVIYFICVLSLFSIDKFNYYNYGNKFELKQFSVLSESKDSVTCYVLFKIMNDAISFKSNVNSFKSNPAIEIIIKNKEGVIKKRINWEKEYQVDNFLSTLSKENYLEGFIKVELKNENYKIEANLIKDIKKDKLDYSSDIIKITENQNIINNPLFVKNDGSFINNSPFINKKGFNFGSIPVRVYLPLINNIQGTYSYELKTVKLEKKDDSENEENFIKWDDKIDISGEIKRLNYKYLQFTKEIDKIKFSIDQSRGDNAFLYLDFPIEKMVPSDYKLTIYRDNESIGEILFPVVWEDRPISLKNLKFATNSMYYLLNDAEFDDLDDSDDKEKTRKILDFWKKKDPTPETPFNESMNQYFQRVDYAYFNFSTLAEKDGSKTDRGKIFILKGKPDQIKETNNEDRKSESWYYQNLNEYYIFEIVDSGIYKLMEIKKGD